MEKEDNNIIFVVAKEFQKYMLATQMQFEKNQTVILKSRGKFTSKVIDIVEVMKLKHGVTVDEIKIGSEKFTKEEEGKEPKEIRVSNIEIVVSKKKEE